MTMAMARRNFPPAGARRAFGSEKPIFGRRDRGWRGGNAGRAERRAAA
jgi:hypothetical protein